MRAVVGCSDPGSESSATPQRHSIASARRQASGRRGRLQEWHQLHGGAEDVDAKRIPALKKTVVSEHGKEAVVALLGTGDFFGERYLTGQQLRLSTVTAVTECVIVRIAKTDITRVIHPAVRLQPLKASRLRG
jgi:hypothetical protein